jgi:hypothetical protein
VVTFVVNHRIRHKVTAIKVPEQVAEVINKVVDVVVVDLTNNTQVILVSLPKANLNSEATKMRDVVACLLSKTKPGHNIRILPTKLHGAQPFPTRFPIHLT